MWLLGCELQVGLDHPAACVSVSHGTISARFDGPGVRLCLDSEPCGQGLCEYPALKDMRQNSWSFPPLPLHCLRKKSSHKKT